MRARVLGLALLASGMSWTPAVATVGGTAASAALPAGKFARYAGLRMLTPLARA